MLGIITSKFKHRGYATVFSNISGIFMSSQIPYWNMSSWKDPHRYTCWEFVTVLRSFQSVGQFIHSEENQLKTRILLYSRKKCHCM